MPVNGELTLPVQNEDDGSLFGSPPSSPVRGRSPQLALPTGPRSAENVGTIALPGSHYCSELALDPAVLHSDGRIITSNSDTPSTIPQIPSPPTLHSSSPNPATSSKSSRAPRNSLNGKERSATPRPPAPTIHFPDPSEPLPSNFLRSQQALLGNAGLIGGLKPSALSTRYHRGTTSQNPIIVEDELDPPLLGKHSTFPLNSTSLPSPTSDEVVSSLVKQRNIFPVLESLLRLLSGTGALSTSPVATFSCPSDFASSNSGGPGQERGPAPKRRRLNSVPAGAADWDVPYPFQQGEGPSQYRRHWEKERLKQLLSQLVVLIKGARRSAAARTYLQQHAGRSSTVPSSGQTSSQQQSIPPDMRSWDKKDMPPCHPQIRDVADTPTMLHQVPQIPTATPLDDFMSFLCGPTPRESTPSNLTPSSSSFEFLPPHHAQTSSHPTASNQLSPDIQGLLSILHHSSIQTMIASSDSLGLTVPQSLPSNSVEQLPLHENAIATSSTPDSMIDPALLDISHNRYPDSVDPSVGNSTSQQDPLTPTLLQSPITSTSSLFGPLTPREDLCPEPDVHRPEQAEDPIRAATLLLQALISAPPQATRSKAQSQPPPSSRFLSGELQSPAPALTSEQFTTSTTTSTPPISRASSAVPRPWPAAPAIAPPPRVPSLTNQRRPSRASAGNKALNKQEIIQRAKERRQQLLAELERAKVELWEATIEQDSLLCTVSHMMNNCTV
ncbi:hypothetical protein BJY52DRAFT_1259164 [Lactarius psammicola]|nr:hypothetical protein BJY52DRAFT_1259164 [Lactarius psammicola]